MDDAGDDLQSAEEEVPQVSQISDDDKRALDEAIGWSEYLNKNDGYVYAIGYSGYSASEKAARSEADSSALRQLGVSAEAIKHKAFYKKNNAGKKRYFGVSIARKKKRPSM